MNSLTQELARFVVEIKFEDLPEVVVHEAKRCLLDSIGCALAGIATDKGKISTKLARRLGSSLELAFGAKRVIIAMEHTTPQGDPKIVSKCSLPLTALKCVNTIITDLAVIEVTAEGLELRELAPGITEQDVQEVTEPVLIVPVSLREMEFP